MNPPPDRAPLVAAVTGVGISPVRLLLEHLVATDPRRPVDLFWGLRLVEDVCLLDDLERIAARMPHFRVHISLSRAPDDWGWLRGRITETLPPMVETLSDRRFILVGNGRMIAELGGALREVGVTDDRIYEESFFHHRERASDETIQTIADRFVAPDTSRLDDLGARLDGQAARSSAALAAGRRRRAAGSGRVG